MDVGSRELRNNTRSLLNRVAAGESITITVAGQPVAILEPIGHRPRFMSRDEFIRHVVPYQADSAMRSDLRALAPDDTDDLRPL